MRRYDENDLIASILCFMFFLQALVLALKMTGVLKCSWFVTILPLIAFLGLMTIAMLVVILVILFEKDKKDEE